MFKAFGFGYPYAVRYFVAQSLSVSFFLRPCIHSATALTPLADLSPQAWKAAAPPRSAIAFAYFSAALVPSITIFNPSLS